ncbi:MAG: hypothetical protein Q7S41_03015 [Candidatus Limnocylindria bacterium]|nr:hypothetical protein [Candidatus Limnocylindria bacterium]
MTTKRVDAETWKVSAAQPWAPRLGGLGKRGYTFAVGVPLDAFG